MKTKYFSCFPISSVLRQKRGLVCLIMMMAGMMLSAPSIQAQPPHPRKVVKHVHQRISGFFYKAARVLEGDQGESPQKKRSRSHRAREAERELELASGIHRPNATHSPRGEVRSTNGSESKIIAPTSSSSWNQRESRRTESDLQPPSNQYDVSNGSSSSVSPATTARPGIVLKNRQQVQNAQSNLPETNTRDVIPSGERDLASISSNDLRPNQSTSRASSGQSDTQIREEATTSKKDDSFGHQQTSRSAHTNQTSEPEYAKPVPGKSGFVYPPGAEHTSSNMLDVRGLSSGQKAKDPRSGAVFLVP